MKILVLGKVASITHWLEDCVDAWRADGHIVEVAATRNPLIHPAIERLALAAPLGAPLARHIARVARRFAPDLIVAIGGYHISGAILEPLRALPDRPALLGWVGDLFTAQSARSAALFDAVFYTDTGLVAMHAALGVATPAHYLPHAANPHRIGAPAGTRVNRLVFVANPTAHRRSVVDALRSPIVLYGPGWTAFPHVAHEIVARRVSRAAVQRLYANHLGALNIRNEHNVLSGLNQRNFDPCLAGTPVITDRQDDLEHCFEPGREVLVYADADELNAIHERLLTAPDEAARIGEAGRARVLAEHTYGRRLRTMRALV